MLKMYAATGTCFLIAEYRVPTGTLLYILKTYLKLTIYAKLSVLLSVLSMNFVRNLRIMANFTCTDEW